ncbi:hypothetical protein PI124_g5050 [Phytophthora idaei]|nr:hypothetical protein PI124_g5050 [Phytophthora idaei]
MQHQGLATIDDERKNAIEAGTRQVVQEGLSFSQFYKSNGQQLVSLDYSKTLDEEHWGLIKRFNEIVQQVYRRLKDPLGMFAELLDKLAASGLIQDERTFEYFKRIEMREKLNKEGNQLSEFTYYARSNKPSNSDRHKCVNDKNQHVDSAAPAQRGQGK